MSRLRGGSSCPKYGGGRRRQRRGRHVGRRTVAAGSGWGRSGGVGVLLADEFFCIAHDDRTGRARCHPRVIGLGLAAGLLGELVLYGRVTVENGAVIVTHRAPPADALAHATLEQLLRQPQHTDVRIWLAFLAETAVESVVHRLGLAGVWRREEHRRFGRTRVAYQPVDANEVAWRAIRLARLLTTPEPIGEPDAVLAGLVTVTGLAHEVLWQPEVREAGTARVAEEVQRLQWPLYHLLAFTEAAVGDAILTPR